MAVKGRNEGSKLILDIDNGDLSKLEAVMQKWGFRDYQSFFRFVVSTLVLAEENVITIKLEGSAQEIKPAAHLLKGYVPPLLSDTIEKESAIDKITLGSTRSTIFFNRIALLINLKDDKEHAHDQY